jgi:hypothetical protein
MAKKQPLAVLVWKGGQLVPGNGWDRQALAGLQEGQLLEAYAYKPPSNKQERFAHWLFRLAAENAPEGTTWTEGSVKMACKLHCGLVDGMIVRKGRDPEWNFMSLTELDEKQMSDFIDKSLRYIETTIAPGIDIELLKAEAKEKSAKRKW